MNDKLCKLCFGTIIILSVHVSEIESSRDTKEARCCDNKLFEINELVVSCFSSIDFIFNMKQFASIRYFATLFLSTHISHRQYAR